MCANATLLVFLTGNAISQPDFRYGFWGTVFYDIKLVYTIYSVRTSSHFQKNILVASFFSSTARSAKELL